MKDIVKPGLNENTAEAAKPAGSVAAVIEFASDPLCCWSWAMRPQWNRLRDEFAGWIAWRYRMGMMVQNWRSYNDPLNAVNKPAQMAPLWIQAGQVTGVPIDANIWVEDPPSSSLPACLAVKAAGLQSADMAAALFDALQEAVMTEKQNISRPEVIFAVAKAVAEDAGGLDYVRFEKDIGSPAAKKALEEDLRELRYRGIERYPSLTFRAPGHTGFSLTGFQPYGSLRKALLALAPVLEEAA